MRTRKKCNRIIERRKKRININEQQITSKIVWHKGIGIKFQTNLKQQSKIEKTEQSNPFVDQYKV